MMSLWDALRMNMMISYQELVRTFLSDMCGWRMGIFADDFPKMKNANTSSTTGKINAVH
ncbi:Uncharacterised protein [Serratia marcescens]|nr:Uncharacterised protein [Serratia marcescens]